MSSLLTTSQIESVTGIFARHFDTFSVGNSLVIHKEPLQTIISSSVNVYAGYGETSNEANIQLTPVSGVFPFIKATDRNNGVANQPDIQTLHATSTLRIKVKEDARQYIKNGRNEGFEANGIMYNAIGQETVQNYFGLKYYYFTLISTL